jgi:POT family
MKQLIKTFLIPGTLIKCICAYSK